MLSRDTLKEMSDDKLIASLKSLVAKQSQLTAELLGHIAEVEERKLYLVQAYGSMFKFCVEGLGLSESMAYKYIAVARAAREHEAILAMVRAGRLHLSAAVLLIPHLTDVNCASLLEAAAGQSKRQVERLIAQRFPKADVPAQVRKLPEPSLPQSCPWDSQLALSTGTQPAAGTPVVTTPTTGTGSSCPDGSRRTVEPAAVATTGPAIPAEPPRQQRPRIEPLAAARYKVQLTAGRRVA